MRIRRISELLCLVGCAGLLISCGSNTQRFVAAKPPTQSVPTLAAPAAPTPTTKSDSSATKVDPVADLVSKAEKDYQLGRQDYQAGHLEAAKKDFDRAFNTLVESPTELRSDERLQAELDKIVEQVSGLETVALQEGDGFTEQKAEPAPIEEANEVTFPVDPNIKAKAEREIKETHSDLPLVLNDRVASYINYYSSPRGHGVLERALTRSGLYRDMIEKVLKEEGVPQDLIYLAQAESGFQPLALSRAGARGMWQLMAQRASGYGLRRNWWLDERQDPEASTRAAARHLKDLYNEFGDWYLAMAAYNSGPGTVLKAVQRTGYADFWQLYNRGVLPKETQNYVPIILAVTIMAKNPAQYGLNDVVPTKPPAVDQVKIDYPVDLRLVAECVDTSVATLQELNPSLLRMTTPKEGGFELHLPAGTRDQYLTAISAIPTDMRVWWRYHKVASGETLERVARAYHTTPSAIAQANGLQDRALEENSKLIIPIAPGKHAPGEGGDRYSARVVRYRVRKGDTVASVADDFGVRPELLRKWNHLSGNTIRAGRVLRVHLPASNGTVVAEVSSKSHRTRTQTNLRAANSKRKVYHKVQQGETLSSIATSYNTSVSALRRDNGRLASNLRAGAVLVITQPR
ncbi:MAG TPA: LysM peptidoglycan-binding domain-containing protein [Terriglobales bacterium]|nr:LysM peptidoglycan-binding domain-containing protein [Terriglobales bacterium]